jgi:hypothetical protein
MKVLTKDKSIDKVLKIDNYWNIDPNKTSDYLEIGFVVDHILFDMQLKDIPIPSQKKYLDNLKNHVKVIISNLYHAYSSDPERYIAYSRRRGEYKKIKGHKGFQFGYHNMKKVTDFLMENGYIEHVKGHPAFKEYKLSHLSRMRARSELIRVIEVLKKATPDMIDQ